MDVLQNVFDEVYVAHFAAFLLHGLEVTQFAESGSPSSFGLDSLREILIDQGLKMKFDLLVQFALYFLTAEQRVQPQRQFVAPAHKGYPAVTRSAETSRGQA